MIITQKYNSATEIDPEFIPDLESLLSDCIPSFEMIKKYENKAPENTHFAYYLFFGQKTNAPIGFAQIKIHQNERLSKKNFFDRLIKRKQQKAELDWSMPGSLKEGLVFDPQYIQYACPKARDIFQEYQERDDVETQQILFSTAYEGLTEADPNQTLESLSIAETLVKNKDSYQSYLSSLSSDISQSIKSSWKALRELKLSDYEYFKEAFAYKSKGAEQYRTLKKTEPVATYLELDCPMEFLTIENEEEVLALTVFFEGKNGHAFYDVILSESGTMASHQMAIMRFFEREHLNKLHYLGDEPISQNLIGCGFTKRSQFKVKIQKEIA